MRWRLVLAILVVFIAPVHAEDTAAVLAAMPNKAAEERYLKELCARVKRAEGLYIAAIDAMTWCVKQGTACDSSMFRTARVQQQGNRLAHAQIQGEYSTAEAAYRAKRDKHPPECEPMGAEGTKRITAKLEESTNAMR